MYIKVAQNDETNPDTLPVHPPHIPNVSNSQLSPSVPSVQNCETSGILSRMFPPFVGITSYRVSVGNHSIILKFSYAHQDPSMEYTSNEGKGVHLHTLVDRERKRSNERG